MKEDGQAVITISFDMLMAGAAELATFDPGKESALEIVARVYITMEYRRLMLVDEMKPPDAGMLN